MSGPPLLQFWLALLLWLFLLAAGLGSLLRSRPWRRLPRTDLAALGLLTLAALAARSLADPFPADINSASEMGFFVGRGHRWAAAYSALQHALRAAFGPAAETLCRANVLLGTLQVPALYGAVLLYLEDRLAALGGAALLAFLPLAVRYAASDSAHVSLTLQLLLALLFAAAWRRRGDPWLAAQALGWSALGANTRAEALLYLPAVVLVALAAPRGPAPTRASWGARALMAAAAAALFFPAADQGFELGGSARRLGAAAHLLGNPWFTAHTPWAFRGLSVLGLGALVAVRPLRRRGLAWLAAMALVSMPAFWGETGSPPVSNIFRYYLPLLALFCAAGGKGLALAAQGCARAASAAGLSSRRAAGAARAAAVVLPAVAAAGHLPLLRQRWTHQLEWSWAHERLRALPEECSVARAGSRDREAGLIAGEWLSREAGRSHRWVDADDLLRDGRGSGCVAAYLQAACFAEEVRYGREDPSFDEAPECRRLRSCFSLAPLAEAALPALPYAHERYSRDPVPVGLYRIGAAGWQEPGDAAGCPGAGPLLDAAESRLEAGRPAAARRWLRAAQTRPLEEGSRLRLARLHAAAGSAGEALRLLGGPETARDARGQLARRTVLVAAGRREEALDALRRAGELAAGPREAREVALLYRGLGREREALATLERWRGTDPPVELERGELLVSLGRIPEAEAALERAAAGPADGERLRRTARAWQAAGRCPRALSVWSRLAASGPPMPKDLSDRAVCEYRLGDERRATADLEEALRRDPRLVDASLSLATIQARAGRTDEAARTCERALAAVPSSDSEGRRRLRDCR